MAHQYVSLRPFEFLVVGITHEVRAFATVKEAQRVVDEFKPNVLCAEAEPRWVEHSPDVSWGRSLPSQFSCIDRPERATRRRLAQRLAFSPIDLYKSRSLGKNDAQSLDDIRLWRDKLRSQLPQMYEVVHEEREEYMVWRTLLAVEQYLRRADVKVTPNKMHVDSYSGGAVSSSSSLEDCVSRRKARVVETLSAVRRLPTEGIASQSNATSSAITPDAIPRIAIVCGVAHVEALAAKLGEFVDRDLLSANADEFPHLLRALGGPQRPCSDTRVWERLRYLSSSGPSAWPLAVIVYCVLPALFIYFPLQWDYALLQENLRRRNIV